MANRCEGRVKMDLGFYRTRQCTRNATIERDGKHYCGQHDPLARQSKLDAAAAAREAEDALMRAKREREIAQLRRDRALAELAPKLAEAMRELLNATRIGQPADLVWQAAASGKAQKVLAEFEAVDG